MFCLEKERIAQFLLVPSFLSISSNFSLIFLNSSLVFPPIFLLLLSFFLLRPIFLFSFLLLFWCGHTYKALTIIGASTSTVTSTSNLFLFLGGGIFAATSMLRKFPVDKHQKLVLWIPQYLFWASEDVGRFCSHTIILRGPIQLALQRKTS